MITLRSLSLWLSQKGSRGISVTISAGASGTLATLTAPAGYMFDHQAVTLTIPAANLGTEQTVAATLYMNGDLIEATTGEFAADLVLSGQTGGVQVSLLDICVVPLPPSGLVYLTDPSDGAFLTDPDGAYLTEAA